MIFDERLLYQIIGERIRKARQRYKPAMSQAQLAQRLNLSRASIVNIESGRQRPPLHLMWQIAEVLETELGLLIPSQAEYITHEEAVELDEQTVAQIEAAASGDVTTRRLLTEFVGRVKAHK
jgi:transcriptional regulator with XRE-family HTH domain